MRLSALTCFILLQHGNTPLHCAASILHAELCKLLLGAKAEVEARNKVRVALREGSKWVIYLQNIYLETTLSRHDDDVGMEELIIQNRSHHRSKAQR